MIKKILFIFIFLIQSSSAWFDCQWNYKSTLNITNNASTSYTNYKVLLKLNANNMHVNYNWSSDGKDFRFISSDDSSELNYFVHIWDATTKKAEIWLNLPSIGAGATNNYFIYYGNDNAITTGQGGNIIFTQPGIKFHSRRTSFNPTNKTNAYSTFNSLADNVNGFGCKFVTHFNNQSNQKIHGKNNSTQNWRNFVGYSDTFFEVKSSEVGIWNFRYGGDFGRGGGLYVDSIALEEQWNTNLWWGRNWNNQDVLNGSIYLKEGFHRLEAMGYENGNDGGINIQFKRPSGSWTTYDTADISIVSRPCSQFNPTIVIDNITKVSSTMTLSQNSIAVWDPINLTNNPKRITGSHVRYILKAYSQNITVPSNSIVISDKIPDKTELLLANTHFGFDAKTSALSFTYDGASSTSDDVSFSNDNGISYTYQPTLSALGYDSSVTNVQFNPKGEY